MADNSNNSDNMANLREEFEDTDTGSRIQESERTIEFVDRLIAAFDDDGATDTLTIHDETLGALIDALQEDDTRMEKVIASLETAYEHEPPRTRSSYSTFLKLAIRVGLQEAEPELLDDLAEAKTHGSKNVL